MFGVWVWSVSVCERVARPCANGDIFPLPPEHLRRAVMQVIKVYSLPPH